MTAQPLKFTVSVIRGQGSDITSLNDGNTSTGWFPGWNQGDYPVRALIEFDGEYFIQKVRFFDNVGKPKLSIYSKVGIKETKLLEKELGLYQSWQEWEIPTQEKVRYLIVEISDIQGDKPVTELEFYGSKTDKPVPPLPPVKFSGDALKLGLNGFSWVPQDLNPTPNIRVYQMYDWTWLSDGVLFEPSWIDQKYDSYLQEAKSKNKTVIFCINKIPTFLSSKSRQDWQWGRIHKDGLNPNDPSSYREVAEYAWQIAARYGTKTYPSDLLKISKQPKYQGFPLTQPKSGLNLIKYLEFENEPDRPWNDDFGKYTPQQLAAFCSAVWDGHEGKLGQYVGVKNADPSLKIVLPSLSTINPWFLSQMKKWFDGNRKDKRFCADVISVHHYCNIQNPWPGHDVNLVNGAGINPDQDHLEVRLKEFNQFIRQNFPKGTEVWFGEFGYDTQRPSTQLSQYPLLYGNKTAENLQSQWNLRCYLFGLVSGMDKIMAFNLCDENSAPSGYLFGSSGFLTSEQSGFKKKESWVALDWFIREINGYKFASDKSIHGVRIFEFRSGLQSKFVYYSPTSSNSFKEFKIGDVNLVATEDIKVHRVNRLLYHGKVHELKENKYQVK